MKEIHNFVGLGVHISPILSTVGRLHVFHLLGLVSLSLSLSLIFAVFAKKTRWLESMSHLSTLLSSFFLRAARGGRLLEGNKVLFPSDSEAEELLAFVSAPTADAAKGALTSQQRGGSMCENGYPAPPPYILSAFVFYGPIVWAHSLSLLGLRPCLTGFQGTTAERCFLLWRKSLFILYRVLETVESLYPLSPSIEGIYFPSLYQYSVQIWISPFITTWLPAPHRRWSRC